MYRKLASAILVAGALNAKYAFAMGLGGMTMHSALNQPLDAEISLSSVDNLDTSQIFIGLASQEEFAKAGVDRTFFLSDIKFEIVLDGRGGGVVKLHSTKRLNEPYLDVLLEAKWPTGRVLRSYTALVDLPVYAENKATDIAVAETSASVPATDLGFQPAANSTFENTSVAAAVSKPSAAPVKNKPITTPKSVVKSSAPRAAVVNTGDNYQVKRGETLSQVAQKLKASDDVTLNQTMLAIQRLNPSAFIRNNINLMKSGAVLRVPTEADIRQVTSTAARSEVAEQNREWRGRQVDATDIKPSKSIVVPVKDEGHLSLTSAGAGMANGHDNVKKVESQATTAKGSVAGDTSAKAAALKTEAKEIKKMIEVKDAELAKLQKNLTTSKVDEAKTKLEAPAPVENKQEATSKTPDIASVDVKPEASVTKPAEAKIEPAPVSPKLEAPVVEEESWLDKIKNNPLYIGIPGFLLIFGVVAVLFRRRAQADRQAMAENDFDNFDFDHDRDDEVEENDSVEADTEESVIADSYTESEDDSTHAIDEEEAVQTADPIGEADIYVAYGRFDQAIELLNKSLKSAPGNVEIRKKLLEIYVESKNKQGFQEQYLVLRDAKNTSATIFAKELLTSADGVNDWLDDLPEEEKEIEEAVTQFIAPVDEEDEVINLDDFDDLATEAHVDEEPESSVDIIDTDFDLDLGLGETDFDLSEEADVVLEDADVNLDMNLDELSDFNVDLDSASFESTDTVDDSANTFDLDTDITLDEELDGNLDFADMDFSAGIVDAEVAPEDSALSDDVSFDLADDSFALANVAEEDPLSFDLTLEDNNVSEEVIAEVVSFDEVDLSNDFADTLEPEIELPVTTPELKEVPPVAEEAKVVEAHVSAPLAALESEDLEFLTDGDEVSTKLDLAQAYVDLGDVDGAREILLEVIKEGKEEQKAEAAALLDSLD